jgi:hypothetical protein
LGFKGRKKKIAQPVLPGDGKQATREYLDLGLLDLLPPLEKFCPRATVVDKTRYSEFSMIAMSTRHSASGLTGHVHRLTFQGGNMECEVHLGGDLSVRLPVSPDLDLEKGMPVCVEIVSLEGSVFRVRDNQLIETGGRP